MVHPISKTTIFAVARLWVKKIIGLENIPKEGGFIIAANHCSYLDDFTVAPAVIMHTNRKVHMYCNDWYYKFKLIAAFLKRHECIPISIQTNNKKTNKEAFELALDYLKKGEPVGVFPEGGRSLDGKLRPAKTGIAKLALTSKIPVLPIGVVGSHKVFPKGSIFPKFKRFDVKIGKLIYLDKFFGKEDNKKILKEVASLIMKEVGKLSGQEYRY